MKVGQEGDTRKYRRLKRDDYYEAKAAAEADLITRWERCAVCGERLKGQMYSYGDGEHVCFRCFNEPL